MAVRRFAEKDREKLRQIYLASRRHTFTWLEVEAYRLADFDRDTEGETIWVSQYGDEVVGFISACEAERFIHHLFLLPDRTAKGYGSELLRTCLAQIGRPAQLKCLVRNRSALGFYRSRGWLVTAKAHDARDGAYYVMRYGG